MTKILIFGGSGMLGHKLIQKWRDRFDVFSTVRSDFERIEKYGIFDRSKIIPNVEIENDVKVKDVIEIVKPNIIVNAVGIIKQVATSKDVIKTLTVNSIFPHKLAEFAKGWNTRLITISTDCVFRGDRGNYTEDDISDAVDLYGKSKYLGEVSAENCLTLRTSIIGRELSSAHSLVEWFLSNRGKKVSGYINAIYSGFPTVIFADIIADLIENHAALQGVYQVSSEPINKYELLKLINENYGAEIEIEPFEDFKLDRSLDSTRFRKETGFEPKSWTEMIEAMAADPTPYDEWKNKSNSTN
jgi:dTDP-4-dehydrorhamnose reductase